MKIIKFYGGLGNQLFQYAMLVAIREHFKEEVLLDTSVYTSYGLHNGLEINHIFATTANEATPDQIKKVSWFTTNYKLLRLIHYCFPARKTEFKERTYGKYYPEVFEKSGDCLYDGYWQYYKYFDFAREEILKEYSYKHEFSKVNEDLSKQMLADNKSVSIHIRRGDYLKSKEYKGICELDYYQRAITKLREVIGENANVYIFSNDIKWCKANIFPILAHEKVTFIDWNVGKESYNDMRLMHYCRVNIIAASSFSWWGAYLNQREDKIVIAPKKWINLPMEYEIPLPDWIKV